MPSPPDFETLGYRVAGSGVAFISIDVPGRKLNVLTPELHREIGVVAGLLAADDAAAGAIIHSGKDSFLAGGDLNRIVEYFGQGRSAEAAYTQSRPYTESLRKLETCGKPVAVAINGSALGGGLELALACHHRVVVDDPGLQLGLPEVTLGLMPGGGGTQRLPRLVGISKAAELILSGDKLNPVQALEAGMVDVLAPADDLLNCAEKWVLNDGVAEQPWDRRGYRVPGGSGLGHPHIGGLFLQLTAGVGSRYRHNYPAPIAALRSIFNGTTVKSMDAALKIETREFSALTRDPVARNIIRTLFINKGRRRRAEKEAPQEYQDRDARVVELCLESFRAEGRRMADEGIKPGLIENAAYAAGMPEGPLSMAGENDIRVAGKLIDARIAQERLLCAQALAVAEAWVAGEVDAVDADIASVAGAGFPSWTGGVMSYIDTMGLAAFMALCERLAGDVSDAFQPSERLRERAAKNDLVYLTA